MCWGKVIQGGLVRYVLCAGGRSYRVVWLDMYCVKGEGHTAFKIKDAPTPGVHNLEAGCTGFRTCAPGRCIFFLHFQYDYIEVNSFTYCRVPGVDGYAPGGYTE